MTDDELTGKSEIDPNLLAPTIKLWRNPETAKYEIITGRQLLNPLTAERVWVVEDSDIAPPQALQNIDEDTSDDLVLRSLDTIYDDRQDNRAIILPGILDLLNSDEPNETDFEMRFNCAPRFYSQHIFDLKKQSKSLEALIKDGHLDSESLVVKKTIFMPLWNWFRGYTEEPQTKTKISVPVFDIRFPTDNCKAKFNQSIGRNQSVSFKLDVPGFGCGDGLRQKVTMFSKRGWLDRPFQGQTKVDVILRRFSNTDTREHFFIVEIAKIGATVYLVSNGSKDYYDLPNFNEKTEDRQTIGVDDPNYKGNSCDKTYIDIEEGYWARYSLDILKLLGNTVGVSLGGIKSDWTVKSESISTSEFGFKYPIGQLFVLSSANKESLRLLLEPE